MKNSRLRQLTECSVMIALATVLSLLKLVDFPYGGSVTLASMLPLVIIARRHGVWVGLSTGAVFGAVQQLLGLNTLSYAPTWQAVVAIILLDYVLAYTAIGLAGLWRGRDTRISLLTATVFACLVRYVLHVISGATVWAGLSIPTEAALLYSIGYNATYMVPETLMLLAAASYLFEVFDFKKGVPVRRERTKMGATGVYALLAPLFAAAAVLPIPLTLFPYLQDPEDGAFVTTYLGDWPWVMPLVLTLVLATAAVVLFLLSHRARQGMREEA